MNARLQTIPQPVVAAVQGVATAAGCQLVASADLAVAADTARFATPGGWVTLFDFGALYHQSAVTGAAMLSAAALIASDSTVRAAWELSYAGGRPGQDPTSANWQGYWCAIANLEGPAYAACMQSPPSGSP